MINRDSIQTYQSEKTEQDLNNKLITTSEQVGSQVVVVQHPPPATKQRLNSLDILRGLTMLGMILVDNAGPHPPWFLDHAQWNGLTPADLIFPSFLFIMGMAVPLAMNRNNPFKIRSFFRILGLFAIGVYLNLLTRKFTIDHFRVMGILQRISLCYGSLIFIHYITKYGEKTYRFIGTIIAVSMGLIYLIFMLTYQNIDAGCPHQKNLSKQCNFGAYSDNKIFGPNHMYAVNDPEGLFTTLSALLNGYIGYYFCLIMQDNKNETKKMIKLWVILSLLLGAMVYPLTLLMPLNKKIWSISFVFLTCAVTGLSLVFITLTVDILGTKHPKYGRVINIIVKPFIWLGRNPLAIFVLMDLLAIILIKYIIIDNKSAWTHFYHYVFASWMGNPEVASTFYALFFAILWTLVAGILFRLKIFIRL